MENILFEAENGIATVTINRPKSLNALNKDTLEDIVECFLNISKDEGIGAVIVTGSGEKAFIAGADISFMQNLTAHEAKKFGELVPPLMYVNNCF